MNSGSSSCSACGKAFSCGAASGSCWCAGYPAVMPADFSCDCRCPDCLAAAIADAIGKRLATMSHADALDLAAKQPPSPHLIEHIDYTIEQGNLVFSAWYLLKQGKCCGNGCRNCPYPPDIPQVRRIWI